MGKSFIVFITLFTVIISGCDGNDIKCENSSTDTPPSPKSKNHRIVAEQGDAAAQYKLGKSYADGNGVIKDVDEAAKWFRKAAEQNYAPAQNSLGTCYSKGIGVPQSYDKAFEWFRKAAEQNYAPAQYNLGMCYATNRGRVTGRAFDDNNEAVKWFHKAAKNGDVMAQYTLGRFYEYGGIKNMTNIHENHIEAVN
ncbi:MAG: sel1 repeat family protein [Lentisphaerae bacterium]|nr:sel1 repeat family protein [Lentisphaerota bacterium]